MYGIKLPFRRKVSSEEKIREIILLKIVLFIQLNESVFKIKDY
jgi:hypothetical protein